MADITYEGPESGYELPRTDISRERMRPDIPKAKRVLEQANASDLTKMLLGEDA